MTKPTSATTLSNLSEHDWQIISNRWSRGIDWVVTKSGSRWAPMPSLMLPTCRTKKEAYNAATDLVLREASHRALVEQKARLAGQRAAAAYLAGSSLGLTDPTPIGSHG